MSIFSETLDRHRDNLLAIPGCTAVAIGKKTVAGRQTDTVGIVVFVRSKGSYEPENEIPAELDGIQTDVVEREFDFAPTFVDPMERYDAIFSGLSLALATPEAEYGTIGCFIEADGTAPGVPAGSYLLTNEHVLRGGAPGSEVTQPVGVAEDFKLGLYQAGYKDAGHDCAIVRLEAGSREFGNTVPNAPPRPGERTLKGIGTATVGDKVYKYGAKTRYTTGEVTFIKMTAKTRGGGLVTSAITVTGDNRGVWIDYGDSGAVVVKQEDDMVLGLHWGGNLNTRTPHGFLEGVAFDIKSQIEKFSTKIQLA